MSCSSSAWGTWGGEGTRGQWGARASCPWTPPRLGPSRTCTCWTGDKGQPWSGHPAPVPEHRRKPPPGVTLMVPRPPPAVHGFRTPAVSPAWASAGRGPGLHECRLGSRRHGPWTPARYTPAGTFRPPLSKVTIETAATCGGDGHPHTHTHTGQGCLSGAFSLHFFRCHHS